VPGLASGAVLTDDPMRVKMLAAHYLDGAGLVSENRGMLGYRGRFSRAELGVFSVGFGESALLAYLSELSSCGVKRVVYLGECVSLAADADTGTIVLAETGGRPFEAADAADPALLGGAVNAAKQLKIGARVLPVLTDDRYFLGGSGAARGGADIVDFATRALYRYSLDNGIAAVSILTVTENVPRGKRENGAFRQSQFHGASRLAFETLAGAGFE